MLFQFPGATVLDPDESPPEDPSILEDTTQVNGEQLNSPDAPAQRPHRRSTGLVTPLIARIDHAELVRGHTLPGERCELTGLGPLPVALLQRLLPTAFLAAVAVDETGQPTGVVHLGRSRWRAASGTTATTGRHPPPGPAPPGVDRLTSGLGRQLKIIVAVPENVLTARGQEGPGAASEAGDATRPATADVAERSADPIVAALLARGVAISELTHHKRRFNVLQRTVLEHRDPQCTVLGCTATAHTQLDHRADWAKTHTTNAEAADRLCTVHHDLKTRHGWHLGPGTGKRRLLPPTMGAA